jgi:hypothetical protein
MKLPVVIAGMAAAGLLAGGVLVLAAEAETSGSSTPDTTAPLRTVSVEGVATAPVAVAASAEAAIAAYRQAMASAIADGHAKAEYLAEKTANTIGQAQSVAEGGGYIECPADVEYEGAQPDFGSARGVAFAPAAASAPAGRIKATARKVKRPAKRKRHGARKSAVESCTLSTQVSLVYQMG